MHQFLTVALLFTFLNPSEAAEFHRTAAPVGKVRLNSDQLANTYVTKLGGGRSAQIKRLRLERVLPEYDLSKKIAKRSGESRASVLTNLITGSSQKKIETGLAKSVETSKEAIPTISLEALPEYKENVRRSFTDTSPRGFTRVWRGEEVKRPDVYPDAVMIRGNGLCSGTLISPYHVISAAHCFCDGTTADVTVGLNNTNVVTSARIDMTKSKTNIECSRLNGSAREKYINSGDLAVFRLKEPITGVRMPKIASAQILDKAHMIRAVGFGRSSERTIERKFVVDIPIASKACTETEFRASGWGCAAGDELSAKGMNRDTCEGDSGGPTYVAANDSKYYLAAVTSRAIRPNSSCGMGGIYVKLTTEKAKNWLIASGVPASAFAR